MLHLRILNELEITKKNVHLIAKLKDKYNNVVNVYFAADHIGGISFIHRNKANIRFPSGNDFKDIRRDFTDATTFRGHIKEILNVNANQDSHFINMLNSDTTSYKDGISRRQKFARGIKHVNPLYRLSTYKLFEYNNDIYMLEGVILLSQEQLTHNDTPLYYKTETSSELSNVNTAYNSEFTKIRKSDGKRIIRDPFRLNLQDTEAVNAQRNLKTRNPYNSYVLMIMGYCVIFKRIPSVSIRRVNFIPTEFCPKDVYVSIDVTVMPPVPFNRNSSKPERIDTETFNKLCDFQRQSLKMTAPAHAQQKQPRTDRELGAYMRSVLRSTNNLRNSSEYNQKGRRRRR